MNVTEIKEIAKATGDKPIRVARNLRIWTREPLNSLPMPPIMKEAYIAATLAIRIPLPEGKSGKPKARKGNT